MIVTFINQSSARIPRAYLQSWLDYVERRLRQEKTVKLPKPLLKSAELVVVFMGRSQAKKLNDQFRNMNYATDVLSFESEGGASLGELVLCPEVLIRQAKEHNLSFRDEAAYLVLHGLLHLLGLEHEDGGPEAEQMYRLQDKIFANIDKIK